MASRSDLRARVARRTGRSADPDFADIVNGAFDEFLQLVGLRHDFKESRTQTAVTVSNGDVTFELPTITLSGFETKVHHVLSIIVRKSTQGEFTRPLVMRPYGWMEIHYPDRQRSNAIRMRPWFVSRLGTTMHIQAPVDQDYSVTLTTAQLPAAISSSGSNPIPTLDFALVAYGSYVVYDAIEAEALANRNFNKAMTFLNEAELSDEREQAEVRQASALDPNPTGYMFDLSDLQGIYPG